MAENKLVVQIKEDGSARTHGGGGGVTSAVGGVGAASSVAATAGAVAAGNVASRAIMSPAAAVAKVAASITTDPSVRQSAVQTELHAVAAAKSDTAKQEREAWVKAWREREGLSAEESDAEMERLIREQGEFEFKAAVAERANRDSAFIPPVAATKAGEAAKAAAEPEVDAETGLRVMRTGASHRAGSRVRSAVERAGRAVSGAASAAVDWVGGVANAAKDVNWLGRSGEAMAAAPGAIYGAGGVAGVAAAGVGIAGAAAFAVKKLYDFGDALASSATNDLRAVSPEIQQAEAEVQVLMLRNAMSRNSTMGDTLAQYAKDKAEFGAAWNEMKDMVAAPFMRLLSPLEHAIAKYNSGDDDKDKDVNQFLTDLTAASAALGRHAPHPANVVARPQPVRPIGPE